MANFKCLYPRQIYNAHHQVVTVSCGKCAACLNAKSSRNADYCSIEENTYKYCYFVTLTYSNEYLPLMQVYELNDSFYLINHTERIRKYYMNDVLDCIPRSEFNVSSAMLRNYFTKVSLPEEYHGLLPFLCRKDAQNFIKRMRFHISNYTNEKIRYYICGEYGPRTFRPHYHCLLFFDSEIIQANIRKLVRASWRFGRIDVQLSAKRCTSYVAKYVNSTSCIPRLYQFKSIRPFSLHSTHFAESLCKIPEKEVYGRDYRELNENAVAFGQRVRNVPLPRSYSDRLFPKPYRFSELSHRQLLTCCTIYRTALEDIAPRYLSPDKLSQVIPLYPDFHSYQILYALFGETVQQSETLLSILRFSSKFLNLCKEYEMTHEDLLCNIEYFYSRKDYYNLTEMYRQQQDFLYKYGYDNRIFLSNYYDNIDVSNSIANPHTLDKKSVNFFDSIGIEPFFVDSTSTDFHLNPEFRDFAVLQSKINHDSVKHKALNDANKIFCYG